MQGDGKADAEAMFHARYGGFAETRFLRDLSARKTWDVIGWWRVVWHGEKSGEREGISEQGSVAEPFVCGIDEGCRVVG